ncbi:DegT/DnrJ/EryC1/StrS family aminotransferase [Curvivirga sp.]|uniref:DegT/DnrJ/EryC1/StrS family aminotransferase n=1 Tax=Curvivirga sp. TaxID=2856848 RepID=UPI003B5C9575
MHYELTSSSWGPEEKEALLKVVEGGYFTMGELVATFEDQFAAYHGKKYGIMVNSGSSANLAATAALFYKKDNPLKRGDEVIVPAISWSTMYHPLQQYGLKLKFVDVELDSLNVDIDALEAAITPQTKMIVAVSILGNPAALDRMRDLADKHGLYFLEDNCESMDAELNGKKAGSFGDLCTSSFFYSHHISTMEGGMVITDDYELMQLCRAIRAHGWNRDLPSDSDLYEKSSNDLFEAYRFIVPGYNLRSGEINAAIGLEQLKKLPNLTAIRRKNWLHFKSKFEDDDRFIIQKENGKSSAFCFPMIINPSTNIDRMKIFATLKDADIGHRIITGGCFTRHDVIKYYDYEIVGDLPNANLAHDYGFFVGNHPRDIAKEINYLHATLAGI